MKRPSRLGIASVPAGLAALALAAVASPASAALRSAVPAISVSAGPSAGDPATLSATVADSNGVLLQSLTVHVSSSTMTDVYDVTMQLQPGGTPASQIWTATAPVRPARSRGRDLHDHGRRLRRY